MTSLSDIEVNAETSVEYDPAEVEAAIRTIAKAEAEGVVEEIELPEPEPEPAPEPEDGDGYGAGGYGDGGYGEKVDELLERVEDTRKRVELAANPDHVEVLETGEPAEAFHPHAAWGPIVTVEAPVQWRSAVVDAEEAGRTTITVHEIDFERGERYELGDVYASREIETVGGLERVPVEVTLEPGTYFISRADDPVPMRRVATDVDWTSFNEGHDFPLRFECSWQVGRQPGTNAFDRYVDEGWDRILHYFADLELGYQEGD